MKKTFTTILALFLMLMFAFPSFAAVGIVRDGALEGTATDINFGSLGDSLTNDGSLWTFNLLLAGTGNGGSTSMTSTTLAVPVTFGFIRKAIANDDAFLAGTMADGTPGKLLTIYITWNPGSKTYVVTPATSNVFTSASFNAVGDHATFLWDATDGWVPWSNNSVTIALP